VAGFARSGDRPLKAQLGGKLDPAHRRPFYGRAFNDLCLGEASWQKYATHLAGDLEILEGSDGSDELHGNDLDNIIWGREGNDHLYGHGGDDVVDGLLDDDNLYGGPGRDALHGGGGFDWLHAGDGERDRELSCGDGGGKLVSGDGKDPAAHQCGGGS
jgi:Ca2+-binding RTX toxin-like protein